MIYLGHALQMIRSRAEIAAQRSRHIDSPWGSAADPAPTASELFLIDRGFTCS